MATSFTACCLLLLSSFVHGLAESALKLQRSSGTEFGPLCSRKCEKTDEQLADDDIPLYQCSCSRSCAVYQDCCFDSPHTNGLWRRKDFVCLSVVGHDRYKAVSGCPPHQPAGFCKESLGHLPPVTSRVTNITYTNLFCANCNGDNEDLITWKVELRCASDRNTGAEAKYIYRYGKIWSFDEATGSKSLCKYHIHFNDSSFLEGLELRSCSANARKISRCSPSWEEASVMEKCRSYEDPIYVHNTAYRNAHCAQCNYLKLEFADCVPKHVRSVLETGMVDSKVKQFCKTRGFDACIQSLSDQSKGGTYSFAHLVGISEKSCVPPRGRRCCRGEAFNRRTQRCKKTRN